MYFLSLTGPDMSMCCAEKIVLIDVIIGQMKTVCVKTRSTYCDCNSMLLARSFLPCYPPSSQCFDYVTVPHLGP